MQRIPRAARRHCCRIVGMHACVSCAERGGRRTTFYRTHAQARPRSQLTGTPFYGSSVLLLLHRDVKIEFTLGPGQYATMLLREIMDLAKRPPPPARSRHIIFADSDDEGGTSS